MNLLSPLLQHELSLSRLMNYTSCFSFMRVECLMPPAACLLPLNPLPTIALKALVISTVEMEKVAMAEVAVARTMVVVVDLLLEISLASLNSLIMPTDQFVKCSTSLAMLPFNETFGLTTPSIWSSSVFFGELHYTSTIFPLRCNLVSWFGCNSPYHQRPESLESFVWNIQWWWAYLSRWKIPSSHSTFRWFLFSHSLLLLFGS